MPKGSHDNSHDFAGGSLALARRRLASIVAAYLTFPSLSIAAPRDDIVIKPITPSINDSTPYGRLSNVGPYGYPKGPISVPMADGRLFEVWAPPNAREAHLVVFSHAELELPQNYHNLLKHWASHGFIVVAPLHDDSVMRNGLMAHRRDSYGGQWDPAEIFKNDDFWRERPRVCRSVLDIIPKLEQAARIRIQDERPIISGHSLGSFAGQLLVGVRPILNGAVLDEFDSRFYAAMLLSPNGVGVLGLTKNSWDDLKRPILVATGNGDSDATGQTPNDKLAPFIYSPPGNRHLAWFGRINHTLWDGEQDLPGTMQELIFADLLAVSTAYLIAYGRYDQDMFTLLSGDYFDKASSQRLYMRYR